MKRNVSFAIAVLAALAAAEPATAQETLAARWRTVPADSAALAALVAATMERGDEPALRAALAAATDGSRPEDVRAHAVSAVFGTLYESSPPHLLRIHHVRVVEFRTLGQRCERPVAWLPGDTLRVCASTPVSVGHGPPTPSAGVGSSLRDSALSVLRVVARDDPSLVVAGMADWVLHTARYMVPARADFPAARCPDGAPEVGRRLAEHPLRRDGRGPADTARVYRLDEVDRPPAVAQGCTASRRIERQYPPLLLDRRETGTAVLSLVVGRDGRPREVQVVESSHPGFGLAACRGLGSIRFVPATVGTTEVDARITLPVRFELNNHFPRRAESR